ncbi:MAG TPA: hypothetical protein VFE84_02800 [Patescibacteria group bacterium]|nr:hypothetical protein [Patescibacteria group bacterium]
MRRRWNSFIWIGALVVLVAGATYLPFVELLPGLADWITLAVQLAGLFLIAAGVLRAFREPASYRGRIAGPILMTLSTALVAVFVIGALYIGRRIPESSDAPRVGQKAPDFSLLDKEGHEVSLAGLLGAGSAEPANGALVIFYRGYW